MVANGNKFDTQLAEFCLIMGEQTMILEKELGHKAFTHDWDIDNQIIKLAEKLYEEWLTSNSSYNSVTEFIQEKIKIYQDAHELNIAEQINDLLSKMINRQPNFGDIISIEIKSSSGKYETIRRNVAFDGSRWVDVGLKI